MTEEKEVRQEYQLNKFGEDTRVRKIITTIVLILLPCMMSASGVKFDFKGMFFIPSEQAFKDIYGNGMMYGAEISFKILNRLDAWVDGSYLTRKGELTFTKEETSLKIIPLCLGLKYFLSSRAIKFYMGIGAGYFIFEESNPIGNVNTGKIGFKGKIGILISITKSMFINIFSDYTFCKIHPADFNIDIGGLDSGLGIGIEF